MVLDDDDDDDDDSGASFVAAADDRQERYDSVDDSFRGVGVSDSEPPSSVSSHAADVKEEMVGTSSSVYDAVVSDNDWVSS